ncbi:MAG: carboxy terminal-processing peptidase, partial [Lentisphaeria bacterium]|nr:carboxy terminal-processing peptidase [Lentisphaeria bacterium]
ISLGKDMESFRKIRDKKEVVLDLEQRWQEYQAEKKLLEEQEKFLKMDQENDSSKEKKGKDLYLKETLAILNDYISWFGKVRHY